MKLYFIFLIVITLNIVSCDIKSSYGEIDYSNAYMIKVENPHYEPNNLDTKFVVVYNKDVQQPKFVYYIQPENITKCDDNYLYYSSYSKLKNKDFINTGYFICTLASDKDLGCDANILGNVVPLDPVIYMNSWRNSNLIIRYYHTNHLIVKSCSNTEGYYISTLGEDRLFIPDKCFFLVFKNYKIENGKIVGNIVYHGSIVNNKTCGEYCIEDELPDYVEQISDNDNINFNTIFIFMLLLTTLILLIGFITILHKQGILCSDNIEIEYHNPNIINE